MPAIVVHGIPSDRRLHLSVTVYRHQELPEAASSVPEMKITPDFVTVIMPDDPEASGKEIIVFVEGLFVREERTPEVRQLFCEAILRCTVDMVHAAIPQCQKVEVIPRSQNPDDGFADWERPQRSWGLI